jgi:hypothetical protein
MSDSLSRGDHLEVYHDIPLDFKFEVHLNAKKCPYTSRISIHRGGGHYRMSQVGDNLKAAFSKQYDIHPDKLYVMSDDTAEGLFVWLRSSVPFPLPTLKGPVQHKQIGKSFIDVDVVEPSLNDVNIMLMKPVNNANHPLRLQDHHRRLPSPDGHPPIDI